MNDFLINLMKNHPQASSNIVLGLVYAATLVLLVKGLYTIIQAILHLRRVKSDRIIQTMDQEVTNRDMLVEVTAKIFNSTYKEYKAQSYPLHFIYDATRQLVENIFQTKYINKLSMCANLLPPMGFMGTVFGMIMIFVAKVNPNSELNTVGLGAALFTTLGALTCFVILEAFKMRLSNIARQRIDDGLKISTEHLLDPKKTK